MSKKINKEQIVVTGINGFVGRHLTRELISNNYSVIGIGHEPKVAEEIQELVDKYYEQDLIKSWSDTGDVSGVIHLAGLAAVGPSFEKPQQYMNFNSAMVTNLCEYFLAKNFHPRILIVSSGAIYNSDQPMPIKESGEIKFSSPYVISKALVEHQAEYYRSRGLDCIVVRPFNHIGPGQAKGFILPDLYERIVNSTDEVIKVGNIDTARDYTDVRDIVGAYVLLMLAPNLKSSLYNVSSGKKLSGRELLEKLKVTMHRSEIKIEVDPGLIRPTDIMEITGDASLLRGEVGWQPKIDINQTISDFVDSKSE